MKLLLVEDNQKLSASVKEGLEQEGYTIDCLFDGSSALRRIELDAATYDLVILDVMLPEKNGIQVCTEVRQKQITVPILMLTARDAKEDIVEGLNAGADDYLVKPFSFDELFARIRVLLRRPKVLLPDLLTLGPVRLNAQTKEVHVAGTRLVLTLREFAILEFFLRHPNQIVTRDQLLSNVWDHDFDSFSNVVDVHMKNLRKKLKTYGKHLQTIRGVGYKMAF